VVPVATKHPSEPRAPPERVAIELPSGDIRSGPVVETEMHADTDGIQRWYVVEIDDTRWRAPAGDVQRPTL
jgi:hypothetical protein